MVGAKPPITHHFSQREARFLWWPPRTPRVCLLVAPCCGFPVTASHVCPARECPPLPRLVPVTPVGRIFSPADQLPLCMQSSSRLSPTRERPEGEDHVLPIAGPPAPGTRRALHTSAERVSHGRSRANAHEGGGRMASFYQRGKVIASQAPSKS